MARKRKKPTAQPRALQTRPTISFRTDRAILMRLDELADSYAVTRNTLLERVLKTYLTERSENLDAIMALAIGGSDDRQTVLDIFA